MGRTDYCGELSTKHIDQSITLQGWVQRRRDLGGLIFIDLRDRTGLVQVVFNPDISKEALEMAESLRSEYVVEIKGKVVGRAPNAVNEKLKTGQVEVLAEEVYVLNKAKTPPFIISDDTEASEEVRLRYRYLDLRRPVMQETFRLRHRVTKTMRDFLDESGFYEIETPMLTKSTPEGARDYLVPSRVHPGEFYALPQSPQLFKQLLMVAGMEKYYQVVRCFRDEDLRADRQPEFTQVDIEQSFFEKESFLAMVEEMMVQVVEKARGLQLQTPFPRMTYAEAMSRYGSDKPDTRFDLELIDVSPIVQKSGFKVFAQTIENGGQVKALNVKGEAGNYSRKAIDELAEYVARYGAKGLAWMKMEEDGLKGPISKFFEGEISQSIIAQLGAEVGDLLLFVADQPKVVADSLGALRLKLGNDLGLIDPSKLNFLWVTEFPLLGWDEEAGRFVAEHHPFTSPMAEDLEKLKTDPGSVRAEAYDLALNGYELGGGSKRIHEREVQELMFKVLGFSEEEARSQFGFLLEAFEYGAPPHGGIALGLDRMIMILAGRKTLRDTIAFPKTASASDLMTAAPSPVSNAQLDELNMAVKKKPEKIEKA
jgi:aspartyl-tRNA synthetase